MTADPLLAAAAAAVDGEDMVLVAELKVIVVVVFDPKERHRSMVAFSAD